MNHRSITPNPQQPVDRVPTGQLPSALAELSEATLTSEATLVLPGSTDAVYWVILKMNCACSYDGDDE
jgi:bacteriocin leader peptide (microcyclamide/patellamide family)